MCVCFVYVIPRNSNAAFALALEIELQFLTKNFHFSLTNGEAWKWPGLLSHAGSVRPIVER